ncbi:unnamed protein product [Didymodactylos carnosus]|uniref:ADP-ribosylglycohydrolase n=1 Tax=Didymodactylos carnosus TaxID=1234261 RepID=A0A815LUG7_9BILA|nr:unnamed protein product [Didymodactylos carnosus]CAF1414912.1 unnamed protein product [Didymodactylos carnosus]CAF4069153.1 unnamed protein product [Didymodactylos carnosus]CAF4301373.1 unnamed protein product [Didymodactylos carnosus]
MLCLSQNPTDEPKQSEACRCNTPTTVRRSSQPQQGPEQTLKDNTAETSKESTAAKWLNTSVKPDNIPYEKPPESAINNLELFDKICGSMIGLAIGDAMGAHVEFRPRAFLEQNPVNDLNGGGTWSLEAGQWTDDTSMALCLAASLIVKKGFNAYDQLVRYKWWWRQGYMSSTGKCFDIGKSTKASLDLFVSRQHKFQEQHKIGDFKQLDSLSDELSKQFDTNCSNKNVDSNGALMRLTPVVLFYCQSESGTYAIHFAGESARITHGGEKAVDACRYYASLIYAVIKGRSKAEILDPLFYKRHFDMGWFSDKQLHPDIARVAEGSYRQKDRNEIKAGSMAEEALEAALWAFYNDDDSFRVGVLKCVNLGDDTDTVAAIYGQLAGAYYGAGQLPMKWIQQIYAKNFITCIGDWLCYEGAQWWQTKKTK